MGTERADETAARSPEAAQRTRPLRGVTVGAGYFSRIQMADWQRVEGAAITAVCDFHEDKARAFADQFGIPKIYTDAAHMLDEEKPDFVDIVTRPDSHLPLTRIAAERGVHVLCQKPLAPTCEDGEALVACCEQHGVRLMVNENWRWQRWYREIRLLLAQGAVGRPFYARFSLRRGDGRGPDPYRGQRFFAEMTRFLLYELGVHFVDTSRYLWGEIAAVFSIHTRVNPRIAGEDCILTTLTMANGMVVQIDANRYTDPLVSGKRTAGALAIEGTAGRLDLREGGVIEVRPNGGDMRIHDYEESTAGYLGDSCRAAQQHFVDCLSSGAEFETSGRDYLQTFRAVFAGYESAETGRTIKLA